MVMISEAPQGSRIIPRNTQEVTPGLTIAQAIVNANLWGGEQTILLYTGVYREGDLTHVGAANITIKAMGLGRVIIAPTVAPAVAVIISGAILALDGVEVMNPNLFTPALRVEGGTCDCKRCTFEQVGGVGGNVIEQVAGVLVLDDCQTDVGTIDLRDATCTFTAHSCRINGPLNVINGTGVNVVMNVEVRHCDCNAQAWNLAATGACAYDFHSNNDMGNITDASLGAGAVNGHICRCHVGGAFVKNGTTGWLIDNSELATISNTAAVGVISVYGGIVLACGNATGVTLWYETAGLMKVLPSGVTDNINIQAALDALPATGGEVKLLEGTYNVEAAINLDSNQTIRGCGRNTILTTSTANLTFLSAVGGAGTELIGILIADLCIDGNGTAESGIWWTYVDYSKIWGIWVYGCPSLVGIWLTTSDFNKIIGNTSNNNYWGIYTEGSSSNHFLGNTFQENDESGMYLTTSNNNNVLGNTCQGNGLHGIYISSSLSNTVSGNTCKENTGNGIYISGASSHTVSGNTCRGNGLDGIQANLSSGDTISGNTCQGNRIGIYIKSSSGETISGNTCQWSRIGIELELSINSIVSGNNSQENSWENDNTYDNILLNGSDYNLIVGNLCRAPTIGTTLSVGEAAGATDIRVTASTGFEVGMGVVIDLGGVNQEYHRIVAVAVGVITIDAGLTNVQAVGESIDVPEAQYGININGATPEKNIVQGNDLHNAGKTANFNDVGTLTHVEDNNRGIEITQIRHYRKVTNTSGGDLAVGDVTSLKAVAAGNEITPPTAIGERQVYGMVAEIIVDGESGLVLVKGGTAALKATNAGGGNIAIGDSLILLLRTQSSLGH